MRAHTHAHEHSYIHHVRYVKKDWLESPVLGNLKKDVATEVI